MDNLRELEVRINVEIDPNGGPGSILAENHNEIEKEILYKVGKYVGSPFLAVKNALSITAGMFSWEGNAMNTTTDFDIKVSNKTADLNDLGILLNTLVLDDIIQFKDFAGRSVFLKFKSYVSGLDAGGNEIYIITVAGYAQNPNYVYQDNEALICVVSFNKKAGGGGGGSQNLDQTLANGNTSDKSIILSLDDKGTLYTSTLQPLFIEMKDNLASGIVSTLRKNGLNIEAANGSYAGFQLDVLSVGMVNEASTEIRKKRIQFSELTNGSTISIIPKSEDSEPNTNYELFAPAKNGTLALLEDVNLQNIVANGGVANKNGGSIELFYNNGPAVASFMGISNQLAGESKIYSEFNHSVDKISLGVYLGETGGRQTKVDVLENNFVVEIKNGPTNKTSFGFELPVDGSGSAVLVPSLPSTRQFRVSVAEVFENPTAVALTSAALNAAYEQARKGDIVNCLSIAGGAIQYQKTESGWISTPVTVVL